MAAGTVKWFNDAKSFGFITPGDGGKDVFVHLITGVTVGLRRLVPLGRMNVVAGDQATKVEHASKLEQLAEQVLTLERPEPRERDALP